ncbi:hypothetical protein BC829DRAFT_490705 [Chytridium lagenaria]|nr:hypothetical protein BC829DRAFT_490705 [Chytridium lagenaria]
MRMLLPLGSWARSSICLLFVLQVVRSNTFEAVRRGEEAPFSLPWLLTIIAPSLSNKTQRDGSVDLEARNLNDVTPEPGPGVVPLVRNVGSGFRPKGEGGGEDGPEESPGLEKYLTWTLPPGPSTTAIIVATDLEEPTPTPTVNRREYQETGGIYFAERDGYVERRQQPQDDQLQPVLLAPVDPLVRIPGNVPDQVNAASPTPSPRPSSSTVSAQATTSPEVHAAPAIIRLPGTAPIAEAPSPPPSAPSPSVIPSVEMSRLRRNLKEGESELDLEEREVELDDREVELDEREVGLTEGSAPIVRMPSGNIIPAFAMSINATSTSTSITTRGNNGVVKREEGSSSENDSDGPESSPCQLRKLTLKSQAGSS